MTTAESRLWFGFLKHTPYWFYRQRPIGNYIADFYCAKYKIVVEVDGDSHYTEHGIGHDEQRTEFFNKLGIRVVRFSNEEVLSNFTEVCTRISNYLK